MSPRLELPKARAYKHFKLGDLFEIKGIKQAKSQALIPTDCAGIPYVVQSMSNNMVSRLVNRQWLVENNEPPVKGNVIVLGVTLPAVSYQPVEFGASQVITARAEFLTEPIGLYIVSLLEKQMLRFSYSKKPGIQIYKDLEIELPVNDSGEIDFLFIENYMQAIKDYQIKELDDYLNATGFEDCTLTTEEERALNNAIQGKVSFTSRPIGSLMNGQTGDVDIQNKDINGKGCYFINSGITEFGIKGKTDRKAKTFASNTITIDFFGNAYYRPFEYKLATHNHVFSYSGDCIKNEAIGLYLVTQLGYLSKVYSYSNMGTMPKYNKHEIELPVDSNGSIDYAFMEIYIRAIMKQTISKLKAAMEIEEENVAIEEDGLEILDVVPTSDRFTRYLPLYDVAIACGALVDEGVQSLGGNDVDMEGWIDVSDYPFKPNEQMFIVHAKGESMLPKIHPGDLCVFELYGGMGNAGSREGQIVLVRQHGRDNDYNCQYTIKKYHSVKDTHTGRNVKVELRPLNQDSQYKVIDVEDEDGEVRIIATLKRVL